MSETTLPALYDVVSIRTAAGEHRELVVAVDYKNATISTVVVTAGEKTIRRWADFEGYAEDMNDEGARARAKEAKARMSRLPYERRLDALRAWRTARPVFEMRPAAMNLGPGRRTGDER